MAVYFKYNKKIPYINPDDVYIKSSYISDDYLVLNYSIPELDSISVSLSSFTRNDFIEDIHFNDDESKLIFKYCIPKYFPKKDDISVDVTTVKVRAL